MGIEEQKDLKQSQEAVFSSADVAEMQRFIENLDDKESRDQFLKAADEAIANIPEEVKIKLADSLKLVCEKNKDDPDFKNLMLKYGKLANVLGISFENSPTNVDATETQTESQTETQTESQTETQTESQTETPTEVQTESQTESQTETPTEVQTETQTESQTETPTEVQTESQTESQTETPTEVQTETQTESAVEAAINWPSSPLKGNLSGIKESEDDGSKVLYLFNELKRDAPVAKEGETVNEPAPELRFYESYDRVGQYNEKISTLLNDPNLKDNKDLIGLKNTFEDIKKVLDNVSLANVSSLQNFLSQNLDGDGLGSRRKNGTFDGKFGKGTLDGLKRVLDKVGPYITSMETKLSEVKQQQAQENQNTQDETSTETPTETPTEAKTETPSGTSPEKSVDYAPLEMDKQYLVMKDSEAIAKACGLEDVVFYSTNTIYNPELTGSGVASDAESSGEDQVKSSGEYQQQLAESTEIEEGERVCYMKYKGEIYKVRLDSYNFLCPIAKKLDLNLKGSDGNYLTTDVMLSNVDKCMDYLHNKLPAAIKYCHITWDNRTENYLIESFGKKLTIAPKTIAGNWISGGDNHLSKDLAFLNLSNRIRSVGNNYDVKDPAIKIDDNHLFVKGFVDPKTGKKVKVELTGFPNDFGLGLESAVTPDEISNFVKYNNHEEYKYAKHNFDTDPDNVFYKKVY